MVDYSTKENYARYCSVVKRLWHSESYYVDIPLFDKKFEPWENSFEVITGRYDALVPHETKEQH